MNDFLFTVIGLTAPDTQLDYGRLQPLDRDVIFDEPYTDLDCGECSAARGRLGLVDRGPRLATFFR